MARKTLLIVVTFAALILAPNAWAKSGKEYKFRGGPKDGASPESGLVSDGAGNFYGTTYSGGLSCGFQPCGTVFRVTHGQDGSWMESLIYEFKGGTDGAGPWGNLTLDPAGNLYGTTLAGGSSCACGTVFKLSPNENGTWTEDVIYRFLDSADGGSPQSGVIFDSAGNLYGTTPLGGVCDPYCGGLVFKLTPLLGGGWSESTLYSLPGGGPNGDTSPNSLAFDPFGNLYGTTYRGGPNSAGLVFELTPNQDGTWTETDIYSFTDGLDGGYPGSGVTVDGAGNLYGEASQGGSFACPMTGCGVIFELSPDLGNWTYSAVHTFNGLNGSHGNLPIGGLTLDRAGNLYGTTEEGGGGTACGSLGCGTIFKLSPSTGGGFTFRMIGAFNNVDGAAPVAGVIVDSAGNLYGTTQGGGIPNFPAGVVFTLTP
jgi:uncharacterized repeat protein (TIGR03803 family)